MPPLSGLRGESRALTWGWAPPARVPKVLAHLPPAFEAPALRPRRGRANPNPVPSRSRRPHPLGPTPCQESGQTPSWELTSLPGPGTSPSRRRLSPPSLRGLAKERSQGGGVGGAPAPADWPGGPSLRGANSFYTFLAEPDWGWKWVLMEKKKTQKKMLPFLLSLRKGGVWGSTSRIVVLNFSSAYSLHPRSEMKLTHPNPLFKGEKTIASVSRASPSPAVRGAENG